MLAREINDHLQWTGSGPVDATRCRRNGNLAIGHWGIFELGTASLARPDEMIISTYRALRQPRSIFPCGSEPVWSISFERRQHRRPMVTTGRREFCQKLVGGPACGTQGAWLLFIGRPCSCSISSAPVCPGTTGPFTAILLPDRPGELVSRWGGRFPSGLAGRRTERR